MQALELLNRLKSNLLALGGRRIAVLALAGLTVFVLVGVSGYILSRPQVEVLYSGLDPQDVTRIGAVLNDTGIPFDVSVAGDSVLVTYGKAAKARMILAQKGLPRSASSGYELFDKLGSLGLTTFMQQVTKVRALEGELARTIQLIDGIKAARVHLALKNEGSFRGNSDQATASVIIRAEQGSGERAANAIRHLVSAAIPGLAVNQVTVMGSDGVLLASTDDSISAAPEQLIGLERSLAADIEARIARTIAPYLGVGHFRISVSAKLNADRKEISETEFDPNSRVERSIRTIKESGEAENATGAEGVTVEQNVPVDEAPKSAGDNSRERKDRKEELTNYEINTRSIATTSEGYGIDRLSVAVVVNRAQIVRMLGDGATEEAVTARIEDLERLSTSAAGLVTSRGDLIAISAVDFVDEDSVVASVEDEGVFQILAGNLGNMINAVALIVVSLLVLLLGLRPALRLILDQPALPALQASPEAGGALSALPGNSLADGSLAATPIDSQSATPQLSAFGGSDPLLDSLARGVSHGPRDRLTKIVELDPDRAVQVLKQWLREPEESAT